MILKKVPSNGEGHHAEEVHPQEKKEGERARKEEHPQDEVHAREEGEDEEVHPREHRHPHLDDISSLPEWHHLASQP